VRAANTGVSGFIASSGRVIYAGRVFVDDCRTRELVFWAKENTFYNRFGDVFIFICILFIGYGIIPLSKKKR